MKVAEQLRKQGEKLRDNEKPENKAMAEPFFRSAFSRCYYSAFHRAREWGLAQKQTAPYSRYAPVTLRVGETFLGSHQHLWRWFVDKTRVSKVEEWGQDQAHSYRANCDYDLYNPRRFTFKEEEFEFAWETVELLHKLIKALPDQWPNDAQAARTWTDHVNAKALELESETTDP